MQVQFIEILRSVLSIAAGVVIGLAFGMVQNAALRRNSKLQESGKLSNGWAIMPGSMRRIGFLIMALAVVQVLCPMLFVAGAQWFVSIGVVCGYGWTLFSQLRLRKAGRM